MDSRTQLLPLPDVMNNLKPDYPDLSENELALTAATLLVTADWEARGLLPADAQDMYPDVLRLGAQYGYPKEDS